MDEKCNDTNLTSTILSLLANIDHLICGPISSLLFETNGVVNLLGVFFKVSDWHLFFFLK